MTEYFAKKVAKNILKEHAGNQYGSNDAYFEHVPATDSNGNPTGKMIKRKRAVPPGLTKSEEKVLKKVTRRAYRLDNAFNVCGVKVGWGPIIGLIPFIGDFFDTLMALMVLHTCRGVDLPKSVESRMMFNIVIDFFIGLTPFIGDVGDALWRCNTMNAALLYKLLEKRGAERLRRGENVNEKNGSRKGSPARGPADVSQPKQQEQMLPPNGQRPPMAEVAEPQPARTRNGGLFDRFNPLASRQREVDVENAEQGTYRSETQPTSYPRESHYPQGQETGSVVNGHR